MKTNSKSSASTSQHPSCNHTQEYRSPDGAMLGSWTEIRIDHTNYIACTYCGTRHGQQNSGQADAHRAYLEQQRRLACPGCGEEPFLG